MYPAIAPHDEGMLARPDGARIHWEVSGNPGGIPALYVHGGPGGGLGRGGYRRRFDPARYLIVGVDQRGCGSSTPWAVDDLDHIDTNTTPTLIADLEAVRTHLDIRRWLLHGVSWGSTLAVAYALAHPGRVRAVVNAGVTTTSRFEVEWITETVGAVFPEEWAAFASASRPAERVVDAYARLLRDADPAVRARAADAWDRWEAVHTSLDEPRHPEFLHDDPRTRQNFATLVTHYWSHDGFLTSPLIARAGELAGIPATLIHGRRDISGPAVTAWRLHRAWPGSVLRMVEEEGHGGAHMMQLVADATDAFAAGA